MNLLLDLFLSILIYVSIDNGDGLLELDLIIDEFILNPNSPNPRIWILVNWDSDNAIDLALLLIDDTKPLLDIIGWLILKPWWWISKEIW